VARPCCTVSLKMLMDDGRITAGPDKLFITYQNQTMTGELDPEGGIIFQGKTFMSPSAWQGVVDSACHVMRDRMPYQTRNEGSKCV